MELSWIPYIFSALSLLLVLAAQIKDWRFGKPDALAKYEEVVSKLTLRVEKLEAANEKLEVDNERLKKRIDEQEMELESYRIGITILVSQLQEINVQPKWKPGKPKRDTGELKAK